MAKQIPWREEAVLVRTTGASVQDGGRVIVGEGPLFRLLDIADALPPAEIGRYFITLPDRRTPPFRFEGEAIVRLLGRMDRPGALALLNARAPLAMRR